MSDEILPILLEIKSSLSVQQTLLGDHMKAYQEDRKGISERVANEKIEQKEFRDGIINKVEGLEKKIDPIAKDHELIMRVGKWVSSIGGGSGIVGVGAWLWTYLKEHLK